MVMGYEVTCSTISLTVGRAIHEELLIILFLMRLNSHCIDLISFLVLNIVNDF